MHLFSSATALAILSFTSVTYAQDAPDLKQPCQHKPLWQLCKGEAEGSRWKCATIKVDRDWSRNAPNKDEIYLRLVRYDADKDPDKAPSIIMNPGGPGSSGIDWVYPTGGPAMNEQSGGIYNIIGFDPRGVGQNMPYVCENPTREEIAFPGVTIESQDPATRQEYFQQRADHQIFAADKCFNARKDIGNIVSTIQTAKDIRAIARAVGVGGDKLIRYWGFSYGTLLGNVIARLFPDEVERMVLDGNVDPNDYYFGLTVKEATNTDESIARFLKFCGDAGEEKCKFRVPAGQTHNYDNLFQKFALWVGLQPDQPNRGRNDPNPQKALSSFKSYQVRKMVFDGMYNPTFFPKVAEILQSWYEVPTRIGYIDIATYKVPSGSAKRQATTTDGEAQPTGTADPNFNPGTQISNLKATEGIRCLDTEFHETADSTNYENWWKQYETTSKYGGDVSILNAYACSPWKNRPTQDWAGVRWLPNGIATKKGILFIQTKYDPVTPTVWGDAARSYYQNARIVYTDGSGHCSGGHTAPQLQLDVRDYWLDAAKIPADKKEYKVENLNPFLAEARSSVNFPPLPQPDEGATETDGQQPPNKRDLSFLFDNYKITKREAIIPGDKPEYEVCSEGDDTEPSSTSSTSSMSSTSTATGSSTSGTGSTSTGTGSTTTGTGKVSTTTTGTGKVSTTTGTGNVSTTKGSGTSTATGSGYYESTGTWETISIKKTSTWNSWNPKPTTTWNSWDPKPTTWNSWAPKPDPTTSWVPVSPKPTQWSTWIPKQDDAWAPWATQEDCVAVTKTICGSDPIDCKTKVVAIPTKTIYIDYAQDVCETGLTTKIITVTATCTQGCAVKPTGVPQGYIEKEVYCGACATPATVTVTVKDDSPFKAAATVSNSWSDVAAVTVKPTGTAWSDVPVVPATPVQPTTWVDVSVATKPAATTDWSGWVGSTAAPSAYVSAYKGAASNNAVKSGGVLVAIFAGLWML